MKKQKRYKIIWENEYTYIEVDDKEDSITLNQAIKEIKMYADSEIKKWKEMKKTIKERSFL